MSYQSKIHVGLASALAGLLVLGMLGTLRAGAPTNMAAPSRPGNIAFQVWEATDAGSETDVLVILKEQADLSAARRLPGREARLQGVYDALRTTALRSQADLRTELDRMGVHYRSFYIVNMVNLRVDRELITRLAARPDVDRIVANPRVRQQLPEPDAGGPDVQAPVGIEWNVARINADDVWELGISGEGVVVAGQDTGYDWHHPALINQYRGYNGVSATHDYNWHDAIREDNPNTWMGNPCGFDVEYPCDDHGHGTHTMGTIVGDDGAGHQIGVAPGARWIGCRNMEQGWGTPATYAECFEFFLAPYPIGGDPLSDGEPSLAPHVINNSWTCPGSEGCDWDSLLEVVETVRAAGIVVVASAGNYGSGCSSVKYPPAIYDAAFSVGMTNQNDVIDSGSSRGPVTVDGSGRLKPDISAPGVGVWSSVPGTGYGGKSGTSMAGPHVAGTVALVWSAAPELVGDVDSTETLLRRTAVPKPVYQPCSETTASVDIVSSATAPSICACGGVTGVPNNVYGWGIVDALSAVRGALVNVELAKRVDVPSEPWVRSLDYTLVISNTSLLTLTNVVLTDTIPLSTAFAGASGAYVLKGDTVTWTVSRLAPGETLTAGLAVSVDHLPGGTRVFNADYGLRASELLTPVAGVPLETVIPWRLMLFPVFNNWQGGGQP